MIKHAALNGRELLAQTSDWLKGDHPSRLDGLIAANVAFKASIVAADERESPERTDSRSRKILNFGHTLAHALEQVTDYRYFKHGEAVGYGIMFAAELSKELALLDKTSVESLKDVVHRAGTLPPLNSINPNEVLEAFNYDKKQLSGGLQMVLLRGIGQPVIRTGQNIPPKALRQALKKLL